MQKAEGKGKSGSFQLAVKKGHTVKLRGKQVEEKNK